MPCKSNYVINVWLWLLRDLNTTWFRLKHLNVSAYFAHRRVKQFYCFLTSDFVKLPNNLFVFLLTDRTGVWFNINMSSYQYRDYHVRDKTVSRPTYLYHGNLHIWNDGLFWHGSRSFFHNERQGPCTQQSHWHCFWWPGNAMNEGISSCGIDLIRLDYFTLGTSRMNALWPTWRHRSGSMSSKIMACCLTTINYYLYLCWLLIKGVLWHSPISPLC